MTDQEYQKERAAALERTQAFREKVRASPNYWQLRCQILTEENAQASATIQRLRGRVRTLRSAAFATA